MATSLTLDIDFVISHELLKNSERGVVPGTNPTHQEEKRIFTTEAAEVTEIMICGVFVPEVQA